MEYELTIEALADLPEERYALFDIRDEISFEYGTIAGAESMPDILLRAGNGLLPRAKKLVLFCMHGTQSVPVCEALRALGYEAFSLAGGYACKFVIVTAQNRYKQKTPPMIQLKIVSWEVLFLR